MSSAMPSSHVAIQHPTSGRTGVLFAAVAAALAVSSALTPAAEARGGGGHGGGGSFGGGGGGMRAFSAPAMKMQSFTPHVFKAQTATVRRHIVKDIKPKFVHRMATPKKHIEHKQFVAKTVLKHKPSHDAAQRISRLARHVEKLKTHKTNHIAHADVVARKVKVLHNVAPLHNAVFKLKTHPVKLSSQQYQTAKIADAHGHHYDAHKKMWFDGRHWWRGAWAWLFIDGVWYYGNRPWIEADTGWTTDGTDLPQCVDCQGLSHVADSHAGGTSSGYSGSTAAQASEPAKSHKAKIVAMPVEVAARHAEDKPVKVAKVTFSTAHGDHTHAGIKPKLPPVTETGSLTLKPVCQSTVPATYETDLDGTGSTQAPPAAADCTSGETGPVATEAVTSSRVFAMAASGAAQPATPETSEPASSAARATECRQFVPAIGMTIEVPCTE